MSSTQGVAADANAEQIVEDLVQVSAQGSDVQCRVSAPVKQIAADAPVFVEQTVGESVRVPVRVTKKGTAGPGPADIYWVYTAATVVDTRDFFTKYPAILSNPDLDLSAGCPSDAFAGADPAAGPALQEDCVLSALSDANRTVDDPDPVPYLAQRVVGDPVPCHAQRAIEARIPDPVPEVAPVSVEQIVERVVTPCPDGQIIDHRDPVPADQVVERVIRAPFVQAPCQVQVPVCVKVPVPQEVSSTQGVAADANVEQIVEDGAALQEDCVLSAPSGANRAGDDPDPVPYHAQRVVWGSGPLPCPARYWGPYPRPCPGGCPSFSGTDRRASCDSIPRRTDYRSP